MKFPFVVAADLAPPHLSRFRNQIDSAASGWHRRFAESIWRRHQHPSNARLSGYTGPADARRRIVHFYDEYDLAGSAFVLRHLYLRLCLTLPAGDIADYRGRIEEGLRRGGWRDEGRVNHFGLDARRHRRGDLLAWIAQAPVHPEDARRDRPPPAGYDNLDITLASDGNPVPAGWDERPFRVFHEVGLRRVLPRGRPTEVPPERIADLLPAQLELGCGPSIEAGIPHLSTLHRIYGVSRADYGFVFRPEHDGLLTLFDDPEAKLGETTAIYRACLLSAQTDFYLGVRELHHRGLFVGPVITNNFDCQVADLGLPEISLRRYDWSPYYPTIEYDPRARSLLVVGVHADRRLVQMRARERGLQVVYIDPEMYLAPDGTRIHYPVEAPQDRDCFVRQTAKDALARLQAALPT